MWFGADLLKNMVIRAWKLPKSESAHLWNRQTTSALPDKQQALMPYEIGQAIIYLPSGFYLSSIFFISSPNLSGRRSDVYHTSAHGVALVQI